MQIGASIWQTPGGVWAELERINSDFAVFANEFKSFLGSGLNASNMDDSLHELVTLFEYTWHPLLMQWQDFFARHRGWWGNVRWTHAPEAEQFHAQMIEVRRLAQEIGLPLTSPTPTLTPSAASPAVSPSGAEVGASIWQTPGGVQAELERINADFVVFASDLEGYVRSRGYPASVEPSQRMLVELFELTWTPLFREWKEFFSKNRGWYDNFWWNHAPEAEQFHAQLVEVRARAQKLGMQPNSPEPKQFAPSLLFDPHHNLFDRVADGAQHALTDLWGIVKVVLGAGVAIGGGYAVWRLAKYARNQDASR